MVASRKDLLRDPVLRNRSDQLRFCCAVCESDGDSVRALYEQVRPGIDWPALIETARKFRLATLLYRAVQAHLGGLVSDDALESLRAIDARNRAHCAALAAELENILERLVARNVRAIAYKGPVFGAQLYGDYAARTFADLDLLIPERDVDNASAAMTEAGYHAGLRLAWEVEFKRADGSSVDLHWSIAEGIHQFPFAPDALWERRSRVDLAGGTVAALGAEDILLVTCFNGVSEDWQRLDRIADVAAFVRGHPGFDWARFLDMCRASGCERLVLIGLHLARELFGARFPAVVEERLRTDRKALVRAGFETDAYLHFVATATARRKGVESWRFLLRTRERLRERIPYYQGYAYCVLKSKEDDAGWQRTSREVAYRVLRLPLLGVKRGLRVIGYTNFEKPGGHP